MGFRGYTNKTQFKQFRRYSLGFTVQGHQVLECLYTGCVRGVVRVLNEGCAYKASMKVFVDGSIEGIQGFRGLEALESQ